MISNAHEIAATLLHAGAIHLRPDEPFTFASGLRSPIYCDNRLLIGNVAARRIIMQAFAAQCADADLVAGTATAGIAWAAWAAEALGIPMAYVRSSAKGHGRGRQIEGANVEGRKVVLLEDTVSTGESVLSAAAALRTEGAHIQRCVCIFTWGWQTTIQSFEAAKLPLTALTILPNLIDIASSEGTLNDAQRALIDEWVRDPQAWGVNR